MLLGILRRILELWTSIFYPEFLMRKVVVDSRSSLRLHVKASPDSPDSPDSPKHFLKKYDVFLIENGKISDFKLF